MTKPFFSKKPVYKSIFYSLIPIIFAVLSGVVVVTKNLNGDATAVFQGFSFLMAWFLSLVIAKKEGGTLSNLGYSMPINFNKFIYLAICCLMMLLLTDFRNGLRDNLTGQYILSHAFFALIVGCTEETIYRGLVYRTLRHKNFIFALVLSALIFSLEHLFNLLDGADFVMTLLQVLFAGLFGVVAVLFVIKTRSLFIPIAIHAVHNFTEYIRPEMNFKEEFINGGLVTGFYMLAAIILWFSLSKQDREAVTIND